MKTRLVTLPGTPFRMRTSEKPDDGAKIEIPPASLDDVIPVKALIEVAVGRSSTSSTMRAARVQHEMEHLGAGPSTVEVEGSRAAVRVEADGTQLRHAARLPFVRRIGSG